MSSESTVADGLPSRRRRGSTSGHYKSALWGPRRSTAELWIQRQLDLRPRPRGFHLVTSEVLEAVPELARLAVGMVLVFIQHTSASLTLNENASPDVRRDFAAWFYCAVPDGAPYFSHTLEGPDDMPAHIKSSLTGAR